MNKTTLAILTALSASLISLPLLADSAYRYENSVQYSQGDIDTRSIEDYDYRQILLAGVTYFDTVRATRGPLAESAFLERASGFRLAYSRADTEYSYAENNWDADIEQQQDTALATVEYYIPESILFISVGALGAKHEYESEYRSLDEVQPAIKVEGSWDYAWTAGLGIAPAEGLLIWSNFYEDLDFSDFWNLNGKYVLLLQNDRAINFQISYAETHGDYINSSAQSVSADYYFNRSTSLGAVYNATDDDIVDSDSYELRGRKFFGEMTSVNISYINREDESMGVLGCSFRF